MGLLAGFYGEIGKKRCRQIGKEEEGGWEWVRSTIGEDRVTGRLG